MTTDTPSNESEPLAKATFDRARYRIIKFTDGSYGWEQLDFPSLGDENGWVRKSHRDFNLYGLIQTLNTKCYNNVQGIEAIIIS